MQAAGEATFQEPRYIGTFGVVELSGRFGPLALYDVAGHENPLMKTVLSYIEAIDAAGKNLALSVGEADFDSNAMVIFAYSATHFAGRRRAIIGDKGRIKEKLEIMRLDNYFEFHDRDFNLIENEDTQSM